MGVWIETSTSDAKLSGSKVTPYVGVWIETVNAVGCTTATLSLLMWECGLKQVIFTRTLDGLTVTPYVGVWIETLIT